MCIQNHIRSIHMFGPQTNNRDAANAYNAYGTVRARACIFQLAFHAEFMFSICTICVILQSCTSSKKSNYNPMIDSFKGIRKANTTKI